MIRELRVQRAGGSIELANEAIDSARHLTACWFIHTPTPAEGVKLWLQGYCRFESTEYEQSPANKVTPMGVFFYTSFC